MLNTAKAADRLLISTRVEETNILRLVAGFGEEDSVGVGLTTIKILTIASQTTEEYALILVIPMVNRKQRVTMVA